MGVESYLVLRVFTDECCHPDRLRVELMPIESFEIGRLHFPHRAAPESAHCPSNDPRRRMAARLRSSYSFSNEEQASVGIVDGKLAHSIFAIKIGAPASRIAGKRPKR